MVNEERQMILILRRASYCSIFLVVVASACKGQTPTEDMRASGAGSVSVCLSKAEVASILESVRAGKIYDFFSARALTQTVDIDLNSASARSASRLSTQVTYVIKGNAGRREFEKFPGGCVEELRLAAPEELRLQCDDDGAYGVFLTVTRGAQGLEVAEVAGSVDETNLCEVFR